MTTGLATRPLGKTSIKSRRVQQKWGKTVARAAPWEANATRGQAAMVLFPWNPTPNHLQDQPSQTLDAHFEYWALSLGRAFFNSV